MSQLNELITDDELKAIAHRHFPKTNISPAYMKVFRDVEMELKRRLLDSQPSEAVTLTFDAWRKANVARCLKWHPEGINSWSASDWMTAITGELGELASLIKMRNRERDGLPGNKFSPTNKQIADEIADVFAYLDLFAEAHGINLGNAAVEKFNEVSERVGFPDRIELTHPSKPVGANNLEEIREIIAAYAHDLAELHDYQTADKLVDHCEWLQSLSSRKTIKTIEHKCDTCDGEGTIDERLGGISTSDPAAKCPDCDGNGYWVERQPQSNQPADVPYDKHEAEILQIIDERDRAEEAISQAYYLVIGESPEWSNNFGHEQALEEIKDACKVLRKMAKQLAAANEEIARLRKDAERLDFVDSINIPRKMCWRIAAAPAGNLTVMTSIILGGSPIPTIRETIDAAIASQSQSAEGK